MGVTTFFVTMFATDTLVDNLYSDLVSDAHLVSLWIEDHDPSTLELDIMQLGARAGRQITVLDRFGDVVVDSNFACTEMVNQAFQPEVELAMLGEIGTARRVCELSGKEQLLVAVPFSHIGIIRLATSTDVITSPISRLTQAALLLTALVGLLALGVTYLVNRNITGPLNDLLKLTEKLQQGEFGRRVLVCSTDEIGQLGRSFNELSLTLEEMFDTIRDRENKLNAILSSMDDGVLAVNTHLKVILANRAVADMVNQDEDNLIGKDQIEVIQSYQLAEVVTDTMTTMDSVETEIKLYPNSHRIIAVTTSPLQDKDGSIMGVVMVLRDVTKLRRLENMRKEFVANVSHELRTPLTSIKGFVETLLNGNIKDHELVERFLTIVNSESDRMITLIKDLLDLSRIESGKQKINLERENIKTIFDDTLMILQSKVKEKEITIENRLPDVEILGDAKLLRQVSINLVDNAIKYNRPGGSVWVDAVVSDDIVEIGINDTGFGISNEHLERIFERFYRVDKGRSRHMGGTGLGLSIVKHIIEKHNGRIYANSEIGEGTRIAFTLKRAK